jgi:membrane fusion protein, multidrug efflux system
MDGTRGNSSFWKWGAVGVIGVFLLVVLVYTASTVLHTLPPAARKAKQPIPVEVHRVAIVDMNETVGATATTFPFAEVHIKTEVPGTVKEFLVKIGETVSPQTPLVYLEDKEYRASLGQAASALKAAAEQLRVAQLNFDRYNALYRERLLALADLEKSQIILEGAKANYDSAKKDVAWAQRQLNATKIYSPIYGVVTGQTAHPGEYVERNTAILDLGQITPILAQAKIPEEKIGAVSLHQEAKVTFDAFPGQTFTGTIYKIDPNTDPNTRVFLAYIELENPDQVLRLGLTGNARLERQVKTLAIPSIALFDMFSKPTVMVVKNHVVSASSVVISGMSSGYTWIKSGLNAGDEVVVAGQRYLKEGDRVRVKQ